MTQKSMSIWAEPDCIFCRIVAGEISSTAIAASEKAIAFMDINPVTPRHALAVPRSHATDLFDIKSEDLGACINLAKQVAARARDRLGADGVNLLNCSGEAAKQTVFHFHIHIIPRFEDQPGKDAIGLPWNQSLAIPRRSSESANSCRDSKTKAVRLTRRSPLRLSESNPSSIGVRDYLKASFVDDHVMVEPTKDHQIVGIGATTPGPGHDVMHLEAVS